MSYVSPLKHKEFHQDDCSAHTCKVCGVRAPLGPFSYVAKHGGPYNGLVYGGHSVERFDCNCVFGFYRDMLDRYDKLLREAVKASASFKRLTKKHGDLILRYNWYGEE